MGFDSVFGDFRGAGFAGSGCFPFWLVGSAGR